MKEYERLMYRFSLETLRKYAGEKFVNMLVEWIDGATSANERRSLINIIKVDRGMKIFSDCNFRRDLLFSMSEKVIRQFAIDNGIGESNQDIRELVEEIVAMPWRDNSICNNLLKIWEVDADEVFLKKLPKETVSTEVLKNQEQFYELFDYQYHIKQRALEVLTSGVELERMLIHMPTGTGKTKTAMHTLVNYYNFYLKKQGLIVWIAPTVELLWQGYETFCNVWSHLGNGEINVYKLWENYQCYDEVLNGIIFCGIDKLRNVMYRKPELFARINESCRLVIYDEAHQALAKETRKVIESLMLKKAGMSDRALIGLTATPGRTTLPSFENKLLATMFGDRLITVDTDIIKQLNMGKIAALNAEEETNIVRYFQNRGILSKMRLEQLEYTNDFTEQQLKVLEKELKTHYGSEKDFSKEQLEIFACNKNRNLKIINRLRELAREGIPTIVFAISVAHAEMLSVVLAENGIENRLVIGDMKEGRRQAILDFKNPNNDINIIINYGVLTTGFDAKQISCVFITRPTKSIILYTQMIGRGLRGPLMGGTEECLLIDLKDNLDNYDQESTFEYFNNYWI